MGTRSGFHLLILITVIYHQSFVLADEDGFNGDDFMNNLFTDLAPLLALFGNKFTVQFLSEAFTFHDRILFAMAPIGIVTAMIGAIRVGGAAWLKRMIGCGRENFADAELELMSSVSSEVCELWDGKSTVRTAGKPEIKQIIHVPVKEGDNSPQSFITMDPRTWDRETGYALIEEEDIPLQSETDTTQHPDVEKSSDRKIQLQGVFEKYENDYKDTPPNLSLNVSRGSRPRQLIYYAIAVTFLQMAVLGWSGYVALAPSARSYEALASSLPKEGFHMLWAGTLLVTIGLIFCARIIDQGSNERHWFRETPKEAQREPENTKTRSPNDSASPNEMQLFWLQKQHTTGDKDFDSCILLAKDTYPTVLESHRKAEEKFNEQTPKSMKERVSRSTTKTFTVILVSLLGFVVQFQGFRFLNWSCALAQLMAMAIATFLRAWARRGLTSTPKSVPLDNDFLLDLLALAVVGGGSDGSRLPDLEALRSPGLALTFGVTGTPWLRERTEEGNQPGASDLDRPKDSKENKQSGSADPQRRSHEAQTYAEVDQTSITPSVNTRSPSTAQQVLSLRVRFGDLLGWTSVSTEDTITLSRSIEAALDMLNPQITKDHQKTFSLVLPIFTIQSSSRKPSVSQYGSNSASLPSGSAQPSLSDSASEEASYSSQESDPLVEIDCQQEEVELTLHKEGNQWKVNEAELEALLSLLTCSLNIFRQRNLEKECFRQTGTPQRPIAARLGGGLPFNSPLKGHSASWRRARDHLPVSNISYHKVVGESSTRLLSDLIWWIPGVEEVLRDVEVTKAHNRLNFSGLSEEVIDLEGFFGSEFFVRTASAEFQPTNLPGLGFRGEANGGPHSEENDTLLALKCDERDFLVLHMFAAFIWGVAKDISVLELHSVSVTLRDPSPLCKHAEYLLFGFHREDFEGKLPNLKSPRIEAIVSELSNIGLGTTLQLYTALIPPLSHFDKLPNEALVDSSHNQLLDWELSCNWTKITNAYNHILTTVECRMVQTSDRFALRAVAVVAEFLLRVVENSNGNKVRPTSWNLGQLVNIMRHDRYVHQAVLSLKDVLPLTRWEDIAENLELEVDSKSGSFESSSDMRERYGPKFELLPQDFTFVGKTNVFGWTIWYTKAFEAGVLHPFDKEPHKILDISGRSVLHHIIDFFKKLSILESEEEISRKWQNPRLFMHCRDHPADARSRQTLLHRAAKSGCDEIVFRLIKERVDANSVDIFGRTSLCYAALHGGSKMVAELIKAMDSSSLVQKDKDGRNALYFAVLSAQKLKYAEAEKREDVHKLTELLIDEDLIDTHIPDDFGRTPLSYAAEECSGDFAKLFFKVQSAMVNRPDRYQRTPLWYAAHANNVDFVRAMLEEEIVDVSIPGTFGEISTRAEDRTVPRQETTPEQETGRLGHPEMLKLFKEHREKGQQKPPDTDKSTR